MNLRIGEKIRELRRIKNVTQEELAAYLGLSAQAISKWENGSTLPDVTLFPGLANFFGVTTDALFGLTDQIQNERVELVLKEYQENFARGLIEENENLLRTALKEFPNDFRLISKLCYTLLNKYTGKNQLDLLDEIIAKASLILRDCTDDELRSSAIQVLTMAYNFRGEKEKAKEIVNKLPSNPITRNSLLVHILEGEEKLAQMQQNMLSNLDMICSDLQVLSRHKRKQGHYHDALYHLEVIEKLYQVMFENGDYSFYHTRLAQLLFNMAELKMQLDLSDEALAKLMTSANHAISSDKLPPISRYTSRNFNLLKHDESKTCKNYQQTEAKIILLQLEHKHFDPIRNKPEFKKLQNFLSQKIDSKGRMKK